jgi:hypothetical protein
VETLNKQLFNPFYLLCNACTDKGRYLLLTKKEEPWEAEVEDHKFHHLLLPPTTEP